MSERARGPRVLVFDSGVGGLSIAGSIAERLPEWQLVYLADNAFFPYGEKPESLVIERCVTLIAGVIQRQPVDLIVIGCNTASTVVLPALRTEFSIPVIGVVPAIKPAAMLSRNRRIGLLATPATIQRPYLDQLIGEFAADCTITRVGSSELVRLCESWMGTGRIDPDDLARILGPLREAEVDTIVLGCTHFPLIRPLLEPVLGPSVTWVDSGQAIARRIEFLWAEQMRQRQPEGKPIAADAVAAFFFTGPEPAGVSRYLEQKGWASHRIHAGFQPAPEAVSREAGSV